MIEQITTYGDSVLTALGYFTKNHGLVELVTDSEKTYPARYCKNGKYEPVSDFAKNNGSSYWRLLAAPSVDTSENTLIAGKVTLTTTYVMRLVVCIKKTELPSDNAYSVDALLNDLVKNLSTRTKTLRATLNAKRVEFNPVAFESGNGNVFAAEYIAVGQDKLNPKYAYGYIDFNVLVVRNRDCIDDLCTPLNDCDVLLGSLTKSDKLECILPTYDFSDTETQANVTPGQQTDLTTWLCTGGADATVQNSDTSYNTNVPCGDTLILPDITVTEPDGTTSTIPSVQNVDVRDYKSGIAYQRPIYTGQTTSFATGDSAWRAANETQPTNPDYPTNYARLDWTAVNPFLTLVDNNAFGNKNRFTDDLGTQVYATPYIIDHLTGYGIGIITPSLSNWTSVFSVVSALSINGFSDYFVGNLNEINSVMNLGQTDALNYSPLSLLGFAVGVDLWTGDTDLNTTTNAYTIQPFLGGGAGYNVRRLSKGITSYYLPMRYHY